MSNLFISHSSQDAAAAVGLKARLEERKHRSVFLDLDPEKGIQAGASWERTLYTKLRACRAVVALCSKNYLRSQWCFAEIALARMEGKKIFLLQIDPWSKKTKMPSILTEHQFIDLRKDEEEGYERLWNGFKVHGIVPEEHRDWQPDDPPYPGLRAFEESDAPIFFGREKEVQQGIELLSRIRRQGHPRLLMVLGASGSGKSSLARAGILPQLRRDEAQWLVVEPFRPGARPARKLAGALSRSFGKARSWEELFRELRAVEAPVPGPADADEAKSDGESPRQRLLDAIQAFQHELTVEDTAVIRTVGNLRDALEDAGIQLPDSLPHRDPPPPGTNPLLDLASQLQLQHGSEASVVLVIDQFEELLGHDRQAAESGAGPHPATHFLHLLRQGLEAPDTPILVLATMRSDYLEAFQTSAVLEGIGFKSLSLGPMPREGMRQVIERPAQLGQIELEDGLTELLLDDTGTSDALPLLAFTLRVMWDRYRQDRLLAIREYEELGRLQGGVALVANETLEAALTKGEEQDLRDAFLSLARPAADGSGWARQPAEWDGLAAEVRPMLQHFVDQRLLVKRGDGTVEVAHEALFRSWDKLRGWLDDNAESLRLLREIEVAAASWQAASDEEEDAYLWRGGRLTRAIELRDGGVLKLQDVDEQFVAAAEAAERAVEVRRQRLYMAAVVAAAIMAVLAVLAFLGQVKAKRETRNARIQGAKALAIQSRTAGYPLHQALLLTVEASRTLEALGEPADLYEGRTSLLHLLTSHPGLESFWHGHEERIWSLDFRPDGARLASGGSDGRLLVWNVSERRPESNLDHCRLERLAPAQPIESCGERIKTVDYSPDGAWLASATEKGKVVVWNAVTGELETVLQAKGVVVGASAFSPDSRTLAIGDYTGTLRIWNLQDESTFDLSGHENWIARLAFRPDGTLISTSADKTVRLWDLARRRGTILYRGESKAKGIGTAPDGTLAAGFADGTVCWWDENDRLLHEKKGVHGDVRAMAFSPDGQILASAGSEGVVKVWEVATGRPLGALADHVRGATDVVFDPASDQVVATGAGDGIVRVWDLGRLEPRAKLTGHKTVLVSVALGTELVATGAVDGTVRLTRLRDWRDLGSIEPQADAPWGLALSPDERLIATGTGKTAVRLWEVESRDKAFETREHETWIWSTAFSADGRLLASSDEGGMVLVHELARGEAPGRDLAPGGSVVSLAFSPDAGAPVLALGRKDGGVEFRDPATGELRRKCRGHQNQVGDLDFSHDGRRLASASLDGTARVWNVEGPCDGPEVILDAKGAGVEAVAFSHDGQSLATGDLEGVIRVWDSATGVPRLGLLGHQGQVVDLAFEEGGSLLSGGADRTLRRWEAGLMDSLETAYALACELAHRNLDAEEWSKFFGAAEYRLTCPELPREVVTRSAPPEP